MCVYMSVCVCVCVCVCMCLESHMEVSSLVQVTVVCACML